MCEQNAGESGASNTFPVQAGSLKKGAHVVIKGFPCKIVDYSISKTGKPGHVKANIVAVDIFTGRKYEDLSRTSHNMNSPVVKRYEVQLLDIDDENFVTLMDENGQSRSDLRITPENDVVHAKLKEEFLVGKQFMVTVLSALDQEKIVAIKEDQC